MVQLHEIILQALPSRPLKGSAWLWTAAGVDQRRELWRWFSGWALVATTRNVLECWQAAEVRWNTFHLFVIICRILDCLLKWNVVALVSSPLKNFVSVKCSITLGFWPHIHTQWSEFNCHIVLLKSSHWIFPQGWSRWIVVLLFHSLGENLMFFTSSGSYSLCLWSASEPDNFHAVFFCG